MSTTVLDRPTRVTPSRGVIAPSLLKSFEQGAGAAIRVGEDPFWSLPPAARYLNEPAPAPQTPPAPIRPRVPSGRGEQLWRWFVVAWLAAGYVLTGVAYFLG